MIYVFNPSPLVLTIQVNRVTMESDPVVANPAPPYSPQSIPVPYAPTGSYRPPATYPKDVAHFVPHEENQLITTYTSLDPNNPNLGLTFTFNFRLDKPQREDLVIYCLRDKLCILDQYGSLVKNVP